jgi:signal transduction histidine kinase
MSPFESIQRSITRNLVVNLLLTAFALVLVAGVSYYFLKASSYEKLASAAEALSRSEEKLKANARRLEEANRLKDLFTDIVRHDLMSAVAAVKGYSGILAEGEADRSRKELFSSMEGSLLKLRDLIESAATISKIQEGAFETKELDAAAMLGRAMDRVVPAADERGVSLDVSAPGELVFEASPLLEEVFVNILSNAVKYSPEGGTVNVMLRGGGDGLVIIVSDRGEGIPDEHKERVFERLERLDKSGIKGSGLGLAIVRRIVRLHGGTVAVTDNPGGGAVFTVRIPPGEEGLAPALRLTERDQGRGSGTK